MLLERSCTSISIPVSYTHLTQESSLYVIDSNPVPAMLLELGFITDSADAAYMCSEEGQTALAQGIAQGILEQL